MPNLGQDYEERRESNMTMKPHPRIFTCGTRTVIQKGPHDFRVVCATCGSGGTQKFAEKEHANTAAVRTSAARCRSCGAA